jgi:putative hydrolase of the HAD superfamily
MVPTSRADCGTDPGKKMRPEPRAILLDMDDTLISDAIYARECWEPVCREHACRLPGVTPAALFQAIDAYRQWYWSDPERHRRGRLDMARARVEVTEGALASLAVTAPEVAREIAQAYVALRDARTDLFPDTRETLARLKERGLRLALLTNGEAAMQRRKIERFGLAPYFDCIVVEGEFGCGKPEERVYHHALETLGCEAATTWMVGDNLEWDVAAPQRLGIQGIWVDHAGRGVPPTSPVRPDRIIRRLSELLD